MYISINKWIHMGFSDKFKQWKFGKLRMEAFSDAVFAIVMTLLVLELKLPHLPEKSTTHDIVGYLVEIAPKFYSWAISFFFVALIWLHHHNICSMVTQSDFGVLWINVFLMFCISFLPFPTVLMGEYPNQPFIVMFWGLSVALTTFALSWFYYYNVKNYLKPSYNKQKVRRNARLSFVGLPVIYAIAALLAFVSVYISFVIYVLVPLVFILPLDKEETKTQIETD